MPARSEKTDIERFLEKFRVDDSGCWLWTASLSSRGYGQFRLRSGQVLRVHRMSWLVHVGPIPEGMCVCHKCDVRICGNPEHLFLGTNADNTLDMVQKGRGVNPPVQRGVGVKHAKLNDDEVRAIRASVESGPALAAVYGVSRSTISLVRRGVVWGHVA